MQDPCRLKSVICVGETMGQLSPTPPDTLVGATSVTLGVAGAESTVALYLARLGHPTSWVSRLGDDPFGARILATLRSLDVDVEDVDIDPDRPTGVYFKDPQPDGTRVYYYRAGSAAAALSPDGFRWDRLGPNVLVHTSGITAAISPTCGALVDALLDTRGDRGHVVALDVNHRPALWRGRDAASELLRDARRADIVFVGLDEAERLWGTTQPKDVRELLPQPRHLVVKDGPVGATAFIDDEDFFEATSPVEVVEPVGAGDSFAAGYLHGLLTRQDPRRRLRLGHRLAARVLRTTADFVDPKGFPDATEC